MKVKKKKKSDSGKEKKEKIINARFTQSHYKFLQKNYFDTRKRMAKLCIQLF